MPSGRGVGQTLSFLLICKRLKDAAWIQFLSPGMWRVLGRHPGKDEVASLSGDSSSPRGCGGHRRHPGSRPLQGSVPKTCLEQF